MRFAKKELEPAAWEFADVRTPVSSKDYHPHNYYIEWCFMPLIYSKKSYFGVALS